MKPGDIIEGPVPYTVCATLNDLDQFVTVPEFIIEGITKDSGLIPCWPLGIFVIFRDFGAHICICGKDQNGQLDIKNTPAHLRDDPDVPVGDSVRNLWEVLRDTPDETIETNYRKLLEQTRLNADSG